MTGTPRETDLAGTATPCYLSVVIPAYNEEHRLPTYLDGIVRYLTARGWPFEVIVVDDGSSDATAAVVEQRVAGCSGVRLVRLPANSGKGHAVKVGMLEATGRLRLFADADGATPIDELERLMAALDRGADVAVASRALRADNCAVRGRISRKIVGTVFNVMIRMLAVRGVHDTQCGFKLFSAAAATAVFPRQRVNGFGFDVEILYLCRRLGYRLAEVPVNWTDVAGTKVNVLRDAPRMLRDVLAVRWNDWRGAYRLDR